MHIASLTPGERFLSPSEDLSLSLSAGVYLFIFFLPLPLPTSAELSAKAGHLLRHLLWLEVCLLSEHIHLELPSQTACRTFLTTGRDKPRQVWRVEGGGGGNKSQVFCYLKRKGHIRFFTFQRVSSRFHSPELRDKAQQKDIHTLMYFAAADVFVRRASFQLAMSPQRKASAAH